MLRKIGDAEPPQGVKLRLYRLPIALYKCKLGFLLGNRFLLLKHWGRKSGELRETVVEVIDQDESNDRYYVASGFGMKSQWYKNIAANSQVYVVLNTDEYEADSRILEPVEASDILRRYAQKKPKSMKAVARLSGYAMEINEQDISEFSKVIKIVELTLTRATYD
jgi:deazaflavin-dependent oxidoreductase (nitroreductase family)